MDILFGSKTPRRNDPPERPETFQRFEDQLQEVKQLVQDLHGQFARFQDFVYTSLLEMTTEIQALRW